MKHWIKLEGEGISIAKLQEELRTKDAMEILFENPKLSFEYHVKIISHLIRQFIQSNLKNKEPNEIQAALTELGMYSIASCIPKITTDLIHGVCERNFWKYLGTMPGP